MSLETFAFSKDWTNAEDFPPVVSDSNTARANIQFLHNETKDEINTIIAEVNDKIGTNSPALVGTPTAPTAPSGTATTQIATTAFVQNAVSSVGNGDMLAAIYDQEAPAGGRLSANQVAFKGDVLSKSGGTMTGAIAMGSQKITGLATPTDNTDASTKAYVDTAVSGRQKTASYVEYTMLSSNWDSVNKTYSFEAISGNQYHPDYYDISISVSSSASVEEYDAFAKAKIVGDTDSNVVKALGTVPTENIHIIIKVVEK